jgi:hypothetical protein
MRINGMKVIVSPYMGDLVTDWSGCRSPGISNGATTGRNVRSREAGGRVSRRSFLDANAEKPAFIEELDSDLVERVS